MIRHPCWRVPDPQSRCQRRTPQSHPSCQAPSWTCRGHHHRHPRKAPAQNRQIGVLYPKLKKKIKIPVKTDVIYSLPSSKSKSSSSRATSVERGSVIKLKWVNYMYIIIKTVTQNSWQYYQTIQVLTVFELEGWCGGRDGHAEQGQNLWSKLYHMQR